MYGINKDEFSLKNMVVFIGLSRSDSLCERTTHTHKKKDLKMIEQIADIFSINHGETITLLCFGEFNLSEFLKSSALAKKTRSKWTLFFCMQNSPLQFADFFSSYWNKV